MSGQLKRYQLPEVVEHLASNYVLGTLSVRVTHRINHLREQFDYRKLNEGIVNWEQKLAPLNNDVPELAPKAETWQLINARIQQHSEAKVQQNQSDGSGWLGSWLDKFGVRFYQLTTAFSVICVLILSLVLGVNQSQTEQSVGSLSYVAVLSNSQQTPSVVASTYGEAQLLMLDIVDLPKLDADQTFELWVTSKTDFQTRSLGEIPANVASLSRSLTTAEWRLIKDSDSLLITIEEVGGSPIGEPMGDVVSQGACVRLSGWQEQV